MRSALFFELVKRFRERGFLQDSIHACVEEQVAMFLDVTIHNQRFEFIHSTFRRSIETISCYFNHIIYAIGELRQDMVKLSSSEIPSKIRNRWHPYFKVSTHTDMAY
jgi:hypothetical protein